MPPTREEVFAWLKGELQGKTADDPLVGELAKALQSDAAPLHSAIFSAGYGRGHEKGKKDAMPDAAKLTELQGQVDDLTAKLDAERKKAPDLAAVRTEYEGKVREAEEKGRKAAESATASVQALRLEVAREKFVGIAKRLFGIQPVYAENVFDKAAREGRLVFGEDGKLDVHEPTRKNVPYLVPDKPEAKELGERWGALYPFGEEVRTSCPPELIVSNGDRGSDTRRDGGGGGGDKVAAYIEQMNKEAGGRPNALATAPALAGMMPMGGAPAAPAGKGK